MACEKSDCLIVVRKRVKVRGVKGTADTQLCKGEHNYCTGGTERLWERNEQR